MKLILLALLSFVVTTSSHAQPGSSNVTPDNPCGVVGGVKWPYAKIDLGTIGSFPGGAPAPWGKGTFPTFRPNMAGLTAWYYYPPASGAGPWMMYWGAGTWETVRSIPFGDEALKLVSAPDKDRAFMAALTFHMLGKPSTEDPSVTPVWCEWVKDMIAGYPKPLVAPPTPAAGVWRTSAVPLTMYLANGTKLGAPISGKRSPTNALCDCSAPATSGANTYCRIAGSAAIAEVALCRKAP